MYHIAVVDDELSTRDFLKRYINNNRSDFVVDMTFTNGNDIIEYIKDNQTDVIISDIRMPKCDGLQLSEYIHNNYPKIKVILMSAYEEFEYAHKAITFNVFYYLLKVIDIDELGEVLDKLRMLLDEETNNEKEEINKIYLQREKIFCDCLLNCDIKSKEKQLKGAGINLAPEKIVFEVYEIFVSDMEEFLENQWQYGKEKFLISIVQLIDMVFDEVYVLYHNCSGTKITAVVAVNAETMLDSQRITREWKNKISLFLKKAVDIKFILRDKCEEFFQNDIEKVFDGSSKLKDEVEEDNRIDDMTIENENVERAVEYIKENYMNDISRDDVAEAIYLNKVYLSSLFKSHMGMTINNFILKLRMEKAIKLLSQGEKISSIYEKVGYNSQRHFSRTFRAYMGYSLSEYKQKFLN